MAKKNLLNDYIGNDVLSPATDAGGREAPSSTPAPVEQKNGIISNARKSQLSQTGQQAGSGYLAQEINIDPGDTVHGRVAEVVSADGALQQSAALAEKQRQATRNLSNSSIARGAVAKAVIDSALPIASQDSAQQYDASKTNALSINQARQFGAGNTQQLRLAREQGRIQSALQGEQLAGQLEMESSLLDRKAQIDKELITAEGEQRAALIREQGDVDAELSRVRSSLDFANQTRLLEQEGIIRSGQIAQEGDIRTAQIAQEGEIRSQLQGELGEIQRAQSILEGDIQTDLINRKGQIDKELVNAEGDVRSRLQDEAGKIEEKLTELRTEGELELADLNNQYRLLLQANQSAAVMYSEVATAIGSILQNHEIKAADKVTLVNQMKDLLSGGLAVVGGISDIDLNSLLESDSGYTDPSPDGPVFPSPGFDPRNPRFDNIYPNFPGGGFA